MEEMLPGPVVPTRSVGSGAVSGIAHPVVVVGDPILSRPTVEVTTFDAELAALIDDMFATMAVAEGVGLAAPQIGVSRSVFVYDCPDGTGERQRGHVVNPVVVSTAGPLDDSEEGCLSVPGPYHELARPSHVTVRGVDRDGEPVEVSGTGFFARCLLHETDHLRGLLFIDHLPRNRRRRIIRDIEPFEWNAPLR
jgi:peptide deformylase